MALWEVVPGVWGPVGLSSRPFRYMLDRSCLLWADVTLWVEKGFDGIRKVAGLLMEDSTGNRATISKREALPFPGPMLGNEPGLPSFGNSVWRRNSARTPLRPGHTSRFARLAITAPAVVPAQAAVVRLSRRRGRRVVVWDHRGDRGVRGGALGCRGGRAAFGSAGWGCGRPLRSAVRQRGPPPRPSRGWLSRGPVHSGRRPRGRQSGLSLPAEPPNATPRGAFGRRGAVRAPNGRLLPWYVLRVARPPEHERTHLLAP